MTPNIFSLFTSQTSPSSHFSLSHHQKSTPSTSQPWPSYRRYLSTKQARSTVPHFAASSLYYTRENVCLFSGSCTSFFGSSASHFQPSQPSKPCPAASAPPPIHLPSHPTPSGASTIAGDHLVSADLAIRTTEMV